MIKSGNLHTKTSRDKIGDQKGMWKVFKKLLKEKSETRVDCIDFNETKSTEIAQNFNKFYIETIVETIESSMITTTTIAK